MKYFIATILASASVNALALQGCVHGSMKRPAQIGELCETWNEVESMYNPRCEKGLVCKASDGVGIGGPEKRCHEFVVLEYAGEGEHCDTWNEMKSKYNPKCEEGLVCEQTSEISIPGAGKTCVQKPRA